ncbi:MAG: hypothetical protein RI936_1837, partial [Pseudomonadota bacterium]
MKPIVASLFFALLALAAGAALADA